VSGFRVYRQEGGGTKKDLTASGPLGRAVRQFQDRTVKPSFLYTYTVAAVLAPGCGYEFPRYVHSGPRLYKVVPPLDRRTRPLHALPWDEARPNTFVLGQGTHLYWKHPYLDVADMRVVVYRSLKSEGDYVAITPPFVTKTYEYTDADAEHGNYWYVVTMLDWATGEMLYRTTPWSASGGSSVAARADGASPQPAPLPAPDMAGRLPERSSPQTGQGIAEPDLGLFSLEAVADQSPIAPSADTYIAEDAGDDNYGDQPFMRVSYISETLRQTNALLRFDLSSIPHGATIDVAELVAHLNASEGDEGAPIRLLRVTDPWEEHGVTWNNQPLLDGTYFTATVPRATGWYTWNVTDLVAQWVYTPTTYPNYGMLLQALPGDYIRGFSTREGADPPRLTVHYFPPPDTLRFGVQGDNLFTVTDVTYQPGATPWCLTGSGSVALGGSPLEVHNRGVTFSCIQASPDGFVTSGTATVTLPSPIWVDYPGGFQYTVNSLSLSETTAWGNVALTLTNGIVDHYLGIPNHTPIDLLDALIHQDLTFDLSVNWWNDLLGGQDCEMATPYYAFEMNPLPLRIVPLGPVTLTHQFIDAGETCTQYDDRYTPVSGQPPAYYPPPVANHGYLRAVYTSTRPTFVFSDGLSGGFSTDQPISYTTATPYGFEIEADEGVAFEIVGSRISDGMMFGVDLGLDYYDQPVPKTLAITGVVAPSLDRRFEATANYLYTGVDGTVFGTVDAGLNPVMWANGGFELRERYYSFYVPPIQTGASRKPWEEASASWEGDPQTQPGLNAITEDAAFTRHHCKAVNCASPTEITFPEGISTDLYLRRGGVSDLVEARIAPDSDLKVDIYGYTHTLKSFRLSFCDNFIFDSEVEADVYLPFPSDVTIPLVDLRINPNNACVMGGRVRGDADPLTPAHWDVDVHPRAVEYRPPGTCQRHLWILGAMDVPHLAPPGENEVAPIPLQISFDPDGTFHDTKLVCNKAHYKLDGFNSLLSKVALSPWPSSSDRDWTWEDDATLTTPPSASGGLVRLHGNTVAPVFGTLKGAGDSGPPRVFVLGWDDYVGFSEQPQASRTWTALTDITWSFDLVYAQYHDTSKPRGAFIGFRSDKLPEKFPLVEVDQALVLSSVYTRPRGHILLGLSAGAGVLRALAETTVPTLPTSLTGSLSTTMSSQWAPMFGMDAGYVNLLGDIWPTYTKNSKTYAETTWVIDTLKDEAIITEPTGGGTTGKLDTFGVKLKKMRGEMEWEWDDATRDWHFERLRVSLWLDVQGPDDDEPLVHADRLTFYTTRDGDHVLQGKGVKSILYESSLDKADFIVAVKPRAPSFEASVTVYKLKVEGVVIERGAATLGVGKDLFYLGALIHDAHPEYDDSIKLGGAMLFGLIDPDSEVLKNGSFSTVLKDIGATGATKAKGGLDADGRLAGGYVRVYGEVPLYNVSCMFRVKVGGEVAAWYFAQFEGGGCDLYGGRVRGHIYGKLLCVVSARGDLTLKIYRKSPGGQCAEKPSMRGRFWAAGGIGFCEPGSWDSWAKRWWDDSWCWTAGAMVDANYNDDKPGGWSWDYDADYE